MNYKEVIESRYNRKNWQLLLHDIFGSKVKFWNTPSAVHTSSPFAKQALWLGTITLSDEQTIAIYEVELSESVDIERNRRGIRDMLLTTWRNNGNAGAFMFCFRKNESVLRFSYVSESWKFADDGSYQKESTDTKRFTYLLGEGHRSRTAIQQFEQLRDSDLSLKDLTKAFSVDAVSDMFFDGYKKQYENIIFYITGKRMVKVANKWEERFEGKPCTFIMNQFAHFPNPEKSIRDYVKKLMGRLVFLQFLQKKGWLGVGAHEEWGNGDAEFIQNLFANCKDQNHFVDNVLEPLFNDLNTERKNDISWTSKFKVPYLNGGLFEREAADETEFPLPAKYMQDLLDFFASYNFTIDENDPDDAEVGVDPEMLGRIFENLLEDNKDKGAFYTPKEIVSYMCRESLIAYLQTGIKDETTKEAIRQFVTTHQIQEHLPENTDQLLKEVKICDPAIGSGAFPMGLLKELFLCRTALEGIDQHHAAEIKKHIIQQNIYGVDIERGAVDIARLRFWLSLIVDEESPQALPNLDFKIMQGNSLLEQYKGVDLSKLLPEKIVDEEIGIQATLFAEEFGNEQKELEELTNSYYECFNPNKKKTIKKEISSTIRRQIHDRGIKVDFGNIDLSGNDQFFLWHTWFHDVFSKGGFDIVIGNPPYGANIDNIIEIYKKKFKGLVKNYADIYKMFIGEGISILNLNGFLCYITPNTFLSQPRYKDIRSFIINYNVERIVNLGMGVFENAVVPVCISIIQNAPNDGSYNYYDATNLTRFHFESIGYSTVSMAEIQKFEDLNFMPSDKTDTLFFDDVFDIRDAGIQYHRSNIGLKNKGGNDLYERLFNENGNYFHNSHPVWYGKLINRYYMSQSTDEFFNLDYKTILKSNEQVSFNKEAFSRKEKIIWRQTAPCIIATIDNNYIWFRNTIQCAWIREEYENQISLLAALAIFNSQYIRFQYNKIVQESGRVFPQVKLTHLKKLPIAIPDEKTNQELANLASTIIKAKYSNPLADTSALEIEIDREVYQLYGLTYDEVLVVDPETSITREEYESTNLS